MRPSRESAGTHARSRSPSAARSPILAGRALDQCRRVPCRGCSIRIGTKLRRVADDLGLKAQRLQLKLTSLIRLLFANFIFEIYDSVVGVTCCKLREIFGRLFAGTFREPDDGFLLPLGCRLSLEIHWRISDRDVSSEKSNQ